MKSQAERRSHSNQIFLLSALLVVLSQSTTAKSSGINQNSEILVRKFSSSNSSGENVPKILKLTPNGREEVDEPTFILKTNPVKVQADFKTVDVNILNKLKDRENAEKEAAVQKDLQSRIKISEGESPAPEAGEETVSLEPIDPEEEARRQVRIKEDIESRYLGYRSGTDRGDETHHYQVKRSEDDDYYAEEPVAEESQQYSESTLPAKEDSFLSIFESLFGSNDGQSQTKKKSKPEDDDEPSFKVSEDEKMKENLKIVGDLLKPLKPIEEPESKIKNPQSVYLTDRSDRPEQPESRIVNNFHFSHSQKHGYKFSESKPSFHSSYKPATEKSQFQPPRLHSTDGYEDYDLEEFFDRDGEEPTTRRKQLPSIVTPSPVKTTTEARTTVKNSHENKLLTFPSVQKKNEYINRNRHQEMIKNGSTEKQRVEKETERNQDFHRTTTTTTTERQPSTKSHHDYYSHKANEVKPPKIYESPNFYNLINLPVKYSTKDTAIPLISSSYANTKIQGMSAHKYEKNSNGKYPNHNYDSGNYVPTKQPSYWATKRTEGTVRPTETTTLYYRSSTPISLTTRKYVPPKDFDNADYDQMQVGLGPEFGGYGTKTQSQTQENLPAATTTVHEETSRKNESVKSNQMKYETLAVKPNLERGETVKKEAETISKESEKEEEIDVYDSDEKPEPINQNYPTQMNHGSENQKKKEVEHNKNTNDGYKETEFKPEAEPDYEYYEYDFDPSTTTTTAKATRSTTIITTTTTTTTTTTPKSKVDYAGFPKEKSEPFRENVAVVVPSNSHNFYAENHSETRGPPTVIMSSVEPQPTSPTTTPMTTTFKPTRITSTTTESTTPEATTQSKKPVTVTQNWKPNLFGNEPPPVFENVQERERYTTKATPLLTTGTPTEKPTTATTTTTTNRILKTSSNKVRENGQESNINIVLVPTKETIRNGEKAGEKYSPEELFLRPVHTFQLKPNGPSYPNHRDFTTEFTVHAHSGNGAFQSLEKQPQLQGHFLGSSIITNPYGDDEPFRPIPKPPGMTASFQVVKENVQHQPNPNPVPIPSQRPVPAALPTSEDRIRETGHEPHEFIPSPQFHRPVKPSPSGPSRPTDVDYDFDGIQTEPKPGQYVIFPKPQLNPELNENQSKKKPEYGPKKPISNVPHFHEKGSSFSSGNQVRVVISDPEEEPYRQTQSVQKPVDPEKPEGGRPIYENAAENGEEELTLELVPPRETQTEKPFDRNIVASELENADTKPSYPRPHWEKNGKPSFLLNPNDKSRPPSLSSQMTPPSLVPPNAIPHQRYRRPIQPYPTTIRKNFNEGPANVKPKPNLPNILPQFRPNMQIGGRPHHRPSYLGPNRRTTPNRYRDREHGNFPYHIQYPEREGLSQGEREEEPEIVPKFITNKGNLPSKSWNVHGMQKRYGQPDILSHPLPDGLKVLRRFQRTPVTTLQMLKHMSGAKIAREAVGSSASLGPPTLLDGPKTEENLYIVYPAKAPQKLHLDDSEKVFIVSDSKTQKQENPTDFENPKEFPNKKGNPLEEKSKNEYPHGLVNSKGEMKTRSAEQTKESEESLGETLTESDVEENEKISSSEEKEEKEEEVSGTKSETEEVNLHLNSNNQWNEVKQDPDGVSKEKSTGSDRLLERGAVHPPSQFQASITGEKESAFTLGAVMHAGPEASMGQVKGQVASVPLQSADETSHLPRLKVNERISNGKIVTVSMPLDVNEEEDKGKKDPVGQGFEAPFRPSLSASESDLRPISQGWTVVKREPEGEVEESEDQQQQQQPATTQSTTTTTFSFENFTPELIGGFKPIFELPEVIEEVKPEPETEQKTLEAR